MLRVIRRFVNSCQGCGVKLQFENPKFEGFILKEKYDNVKLQNEKVKSLIEDLSNPENLSLKSFQQIDAKKIRGNAERVERLLKRQEKQAKKQRREEISQEKYESTPIPLEIHDIQDIEEQAQLSDPLNTYTHRPKLKPIICMRCFDLKHKNSQPDTMQYTIIQRDPATILNYVMNEIQRDSIVINVIDLIDFNGSIIQRIFEEASKKNLFMIIVANKYDVLPKKAKYDRIHSWVKQEISRYLDTSNVCVVSSKTGEGMKKLINVLKIAKETRAESEVYVIGSTNSGKSSFINKLVRMTWDLPSQKLKPVELADQLTASSLPGTTLNTVEVSCKSLNLTVKDTPGVPNPNQLSTHITDIRTVSLLVPSKKIKPVSITMLPNESIWIGGLAKIDMLEGTYKFVTIFTSPFVTIYKGKTENSDKLFERQAGKNLKPTLSELKNATFKSYEIEISCDKFNKSSKDIAIHGLGWVSITGTGSCKFEIWAPEEVGVTLRSPLMPYEAEPSKLVKTQHKFLNLEKWNRGRLSKLSSESSSKLD